MKRVKILLMLAFAGLSAVAWGQDGTIDKGSGWLYFSGVPGTTPNVSCCAEIAMNILTREAYVWNRDSSEWELLIELTQGLAAPSGDPGDGPKLFLNKVDGKLYRWDGDEWAETGGLSDGDYGHIDVSGSGTVMTVDTSVIGPTQLASTAVTPASYTLTNFTVDADGRITAASGRTDAQFIYQNSIPYTGSVTAGLAAKWSNDTTLISIAYTPGQILIVGPSGEITDTTAAAVLAMIGALSGSGTSGRVPVRNGATTMTDYSNFLYSGTAFSVGTTTATHTVNIGSGGVLIASGADPTGTLGVITNDGWLKAHDGTGFRYWPKADAGSWTTGYIPFSGGTSGLTTNGTRFFWDNVAFELELNGDIQFNDNAGKGMYWKNNDFRLVRNGNNLEFVNNTANTRNFMIKNQSTAKFTFVPESSTSVDNSYLDINQAHIRMGTSGYIAFGNTIAGSIRMGRISDQITRVRSTSQVNDRSVEFADSLNNIIMSIGLAGAQAQKVGVNLAIASVTTTFDVNGKVRIRNLPDSTYAYEIRADVNGRLARQPGLFVGTINTTTDASGDVTVTHNMGSTPTVPIVQVTGTTLYTTTVHSIGATTFKVRFFVETAGVSAPVPASTAVTAGWFGKT